MFVGIDLGGTNIRAAIEENGILHKMRRDFFNTNDTLENTLKQFKNFITPLIESGVQGIGIGVPSVVDVERGIVYNVTNIPSWERVPLKSILEEEFEIPVAVNNDVNCFAFGEHQFGVLKNFKNAVGMACGTGLGLGILINNELYLGNNCGSGEIGLLPYKDHTLEYYASGNFFSAFYGITAVEAYKKALQNDPLALSAWEEFGIHFGQAVKNVVLTYDPEAIALGGSVSKAFQFFSASMSSSFNDFPFPESIRRLKIFQSQDENISVLGAAGMVHKLNG